VLEYLRDALIAEFAMAKIVDARLTLIFRMQQGACRCCFRPLKAANISSMDVCNQSELRLPKMES